MRPDTFAQHKPFTHVGEAQVAYLDQGDGPPLATSTRPGR